MVHAKQGMRQHYQPIQSQLCISHQPIDVIKALLSLHPFSQLYIADLNAIQKLNHSYTTNLAVIKSITQIFPQLTIWLDAGIRNIQELHLWSTLNIKLVFGSESFDCIENYIALKQLKDDHILSLDFFTEGFRGPIELLNNDSYWPNDVIVMSLANVGASNGVDTKQLGTILGQAKNHQIYAAGGIRSYEDLILLKFMKAKGALVATAIHQKQITSDELNALNNQ